MNVQALIESTDFTMNARDGITLNYGKPSPTASTVFLLQQSSMTKYFVCMADFHQNSLT